MAWSCWSGKTAADRGPISRAIAARVIGTDFCGIEDIGVFLLTMGGRGQLAGFRSVINNGYIGKSVGIGDGLG